MPRKTPPAYRQRLVHGNETAIVTLTDSLTKRRRDFYLGPYGSVASRELYARLLAQWERDGRRLPTDSHRPDEPACGPTITQLCLAYWQSIQGSYTQSHCNNMAAAIRVLRRLFGETPAAKFGPKRLRLVRDSMLRGDPNADPPRKPWMSRTASKYARSLITVFRFGVAEEMIPPSVVQAIQELRPLREDNRVVGAARRVMPVPDRHIDAILSFVVPEVATMIQLQRYTGMRPGEVVIMRGQDLDLTGKTWIYTPETHKTMHHGRGREIYLGPKAQEILRSWLRPDLTAHLFQPCEAVARQRRWRHEARKTPLKYGNRPGTNVKVEPIRTPLAVYSVNSYRRAITRGCDLADRDAKRKLEEQGQPVPDTRIVPRWHPHQLRHNFATDVRREHGLEAAQILLGHSSALVTEAVYAERDENKAKAIAAQIG